MKRSPLLLLPLSWLAVTLAGCPEYFEPAKIGSYALKENTPYSSVPSRIYVANESSNDVSVIDASTFQPVGSIPALNHSTHDLAVSRDGRRLYATNLASGRVSVIDTVQKETIASIYTGDRCHVVALSNDDSQLWVANIGENTISIVDTTTFRILGTIPVSKGPTGLTFSHDGRFAFVSAQGDKTVGVIDTTTHQLVKTIPVGANPHFLVVGRDGHVWGVNTGENDIYVLDPESHEKVGAFAVGDKPQQIAFAYRGTQGPLAYVTVGSQNKVVALGGDPKNLKVVEEIPVGEGPNGIWSNPEGTRLFVAHDKGNEIRVIDTGTGQTLATVPVGRKPIRVVVSR
ncbi:MAG TPA: cytochrome D1 domain-containing protein [Nitrospira sp.]|nr:cytochrome D1 domain-containing protein [Nitrospira sp.]